MYYLVEQEVKRTIPSFAAQHMATRSLHYKKLGRDTLRKIGMTTEPFDSLPSRNAETQREHGTSRADLLRYKSLPP
jgi:hypothetical protein